MDIILSIILKVVVTYTLYYTTLILVGKEVTTIVYTLYID